ncbi:MAG: citrate synthase [Bacteroidetes bacterium]|nr:MAG: citrate synthase [Bacteroidota bacterium]
MANTIELQESESEKVEVKIGDKTIKLPVHTGTYQEKGIDISKLRAQSGYITLDVGFKNTGSTQSTITFIDGEQGILQHRGYPIEELAGKASFEEVIYLLLHDDLPNEAQLSELKARLEQYARPEAGVRDILNALPDDTHPMGMMCVLLSSLSGFYPHLMDSWSDQAKREEAMYRLLGQMPALVAYIYRRKAGLPYIDPRPELGYVANFLNMMFGEAKEEIVEALDTLLILHADHEQNCSASTVRFVGSSHVNLFAAISAGNAALWGPLHGGANQKVLEMLEAIKADGGDTSKYIAKAKDKSDPFRLMGFGHRVYKNYAPRAKVIKKYTDKVLDMLNMDDPILDIAKGLEQAALQDEYFVARKLFPNVDFYSGIIYRALGIPVEMFTVMFALGRLPGWIAQWQEMRQNGEPIGRPRQIYTGHSTRKYVPLNER